MLGDSHRSLAFLIAHGSELDAHASLRLSLRRTRTRQRRSREGNGHPVIDPSAQAPLERAAVRLIKTIIAYTPQTQWKNNSRKKTMKIHRTKIKINSRTEGDHQDIWLKRVQ